MIVYAESDRGEVRKGSRLERGLWGNLASIKFG